MATQDDKNSMPSTGSEMKPPSADDDAQAHKAGDDAQPRTAGSDVPPYEAALKDALAQCCLLDSYEQATSRWLMLSRLARMMGAPPDLLAHYEDLLVENYERRGSTHIDQFFVDNHGNVN